jgi:hypothetical protein
MAFKLMRVAFVSTVAFALIGPASAQTPAATSNPKDPSTWTSSVDLATYLPCSQWRRNPDGSWTIPGTVHLGGSEMTDTTFGRGREAEILDKRCGSAR